MDKKNRESLATLGGVLFAVAWMGMCGAVVLLVNGRASDEVAPLGIFGVLMLVIGLLVKWGVRRAAEQQLERMFPSMVSTGEFAERAVQGQSADCRIGVSEFKQFYYDQLGGRFTKAGVPVGKYTGLLNAGLSSYCPECEERMTGEQLGFLLMTQEFGGFIGSGAIRVSRFAQGTCPNCASKEIVLSWRPPERGSAIAAEPEQSPSGLRGEGDV